MQLNIDKKHIPATKAKMIVTFMILDCDCKRNFFFYVVDWLLSKVNDDFQFKISLPLYKISTHKYNLRIIIIRQVLLFYNLHSCLEIAIQPINLIYKYQLAGSVFFWFWQIFLVLIDFFGFEWLFLCNCKYIV